MDRFLYADRRICLRRGERSPGLDIPALEEAISAPIVTYGGSSDPHADLRVICAGAPPAEAAVAVVMLHGRGSPAETILPYWKALARPDASYLAPRASERTWYPHSFLAPVDVNEPALGSALRAVDRLLGDLAAAGVPPERTLLFGFSQGACVALEYAARRPRRYGGVVALIGGLFGPMASTLDYRGSLEETPVFLCTSDPDPFVPPQRVRDTAAVLLEMDARVELRVERDAGHVVTETGLAGARALVEALGEVPATERLSSRPDRAAPRPQRALAEDRRQRIHPTVR